MQIFILSHNACFFRDFLVFPPFLAEELRVKTENIKIENIAEPEI